MPGRRLSAGRIALFVGGGGVGLVALLALALVLGTGTIEANAEPWLRQQAGSIPGSISYSDIEAHPIRGHMTLLGVRVSESDSADDEHALADRVEIDVPRTFFLAALAGRLPALQVGAPVEEIDVAAHGIRFFDWGAEEPSMRAERVAVTFDGLFDPDLYETGFDVATDQTARIVLTGLTSPEVSRRAIAGVPTEIDQLVFDGRWDASTGEFVVREASLNAGDLRASGDGRMTVAPTILARLQAGDARGAEDLVERGVVPLTRVVYAVDVVSNGTISFPVEDGTTVEVGAFSFSAEAEGTAGGESAVWETADIRNEGTWKARIEDVRVLLSPSLAGDFDSEILPRYGVSSSMLAEPMSVRVELRVDDNRIDIRRAEGETGFGRAKASGAFQVDARNPEASFFAEPFELRLDRLPAPLSGELSAFFRETGFGGFRQDGEAVILRLDGRLDALTRQF